MKLALAFVLFASSAKAPSSLADLWQKVQTQTKEQAQDNRSREATFLAQKEKQAERLAKAKAELAALEEEHSKLAATFEANEKALVTQNKLLDEQNQDLREAFGVLRQLAGQSQALMSASLLGAQYPQLKAASAKVATSKALPTVKAVQDFWQSLLFYMMRSGSVETFERPVVSTNGEVASQEVLRVGTFNAFSNGKYLRFLPQGEKLQLVELSRQPPVELQRQAKALQAAKVGQALPVALDPSRGQVMELVLRSPSLRERIEQGGPIGFLILALGALGLLIALERCVYLLVVSFRQRQQARAYAKDPSDIDDRSPLGRIHELIARYAQAEPESLLLALEEQLSKEQPRLRRGLGAITLFATTTPLLGLLGTVIGMIETFQSITLFGNGDPKMMSGGISQALVTTMLGLGTAIPLMLIHAMISGRVRQIEQNLEEAGTGYLARRLAKGPSELSLSGAQLDPRVPHDLGDLR